MTGLWHPLGTGGGGGSLPLLAVRDVKSTASDGGASGANTWNWRTLNTVDTNEIADASLASNQISLPAGDYEIEARAPAYGTGRHRLRLYNQTAGTTLLNGQNNYASGGGGSTAHLSGRFTLGATSTLRLHHFTELAVATIGLGVGNAGGVQSVFADVRIRQR